MDWDNLINLPYYYFHTENGVLLCGDCLEIMPLIQSNSVDLIVTDPPYGISRDKEFAFNYQDFFKFMEKVVQLFYKLLSPKGSLYIFSDYRNVHKLKVLVLDKIFGEKNYLNDLIWCYRSQGFNKNKWSCKHDNILVYVKDISNYIFNLEDVREKEITESTYQRFKKHILQTGLVPTKKNGKIYWNSPYSPPRDWFVMNALSRSHGERKFGYHPAQKPTELIERFIKASSDEGDWILDPFAGSGTTLVTAERLNRKWIGIELDKKYCEITKKRILELKRRLF